MAFEYINKKYRVRACVGRCVIVGDKLGLIVEDRGEMIGVNLYEDPADVVKEFHPKKNVKYLGMNQVRSIPKKNEPKKQTKKQKLVEEYKKLLDEADYVDAIKKLNHVECVNHELFIKFLCSSHNDYHKYIKLKAVESGGHLPDNQVDCYEVEDTDIAVIFHVDEIDLENQFGLFLESREG